MKDTGTQATSQVIQYPQQLEDGFNTLVTGAQNAVANNVGGSFFPGQTYVPPSPVRTDAMNLAETRARQGAPMLGQAQGVVGGALGSTDVSAAPQLQNIFTGQNAIQAQGLANLGDPNSQAGQFAQLGQASGANPFTGAVTGAGSTPNAQAGQFAGLAQTMGSDPFANQFQMAAGQANSQTGQFANLARNAGSNPNAAAITQAAGQSNPFTSQIAQLGGQGTQTSGLLNDTASGAMLSGNPFLDQQFDRAAQAVKENITAYAARRGVGGSEMEENLLGQNLSDLALNMYGGAYETDMNRALSSGQFLAGLGQGDRSLNLSALNAASGLNEAAINRGVNAANTNANLFNADRAFQQGALGQEAALSDANIGRNLAGLGMASDSFNADRGFQSGMLGQEAGLEESRLGRNMSGVSTAANLFNADRGFQSDMIGQEAGLDEARLGRGFNVAGLDTNIQSQNIGNVMSAANLFDGMRNSAQTRGLQGVSALPGLRDYQNTDINELLGVAGMREQDAGNVIADAMARWEFASQNPWDQMGRFANILGAAQGGMPATVTNTTPTTSNPFLTGIGGAGLGAQAGSIFGPWGTGIGAALGGLAGLFG